jgi:serine/threonine protein kinase
MQLSAQSMRRAAMTPSHLASVRTLPISPRRWRPATPSPPLRPGELIDGKYRVEEPLGEGSMGVVMAARHLHGGGRVALKCPRAGTCESSELVARFRREAQAIQRIHSPHVVRIEGAGTLPGGVPYLAMELLEGIDLAQLLARRADPLPVGEAIAYMLQACAGLIDTHAAGIVHRDVKPANLLITSTVEGGPLVKLVDFGLAHLVEQAPGRAGSMGPVSEFEMMGSPAYMSPEQVEHHEGVDARADIWSLGAVLYRLLTGRHVHEDDSIRNLLVKTTTCPAPSARTFRSDLATGLDDVLSRCLARDLDRRIQTAAELVDALRPFA